MNLIEHYIIEVHQVIIPKEYPHMVQVDLTYNCYGSTQRGWHTTLEEDWYKELRQGYYLG